MAIMNEACCNFNSAHLFIISTRPEEIPLYPAVWFLPLQPKKETTSKPGAFTSLAACSNFHAHIRVWSSKRTNVRVVRDQTRPCLVQIQQPLRFPLLLPTERKVESGTSQSKCGTSVHFINSGIVSFLVSNGRLERNKAGEQDVSQSKNNYFAEI